MEETKKKVTKIPCPRIRQPNKRICAYTRVSTGHREQKLSFESQVEYYTKLLSNRPGSIFVGIYSDEGISGSKSDRPGFAEMMEDARQGRIDVIYTKSISRFARNTLLFLEAMQELREYGVKVFFEKENIDSMSRECELLMSLYAAMAEEERKQVSSNIQWALRKKYAVGDPALDPRRVYGYRKGPDGSWEIDEGQARVVRFIYGRYLAGMLPKGIAAELNQRGVPAGGNAGKEWLQDRILRMIRNEKYKGDCLLQGTYINEAGKQVRNDGEVTRYYVRDHHPAIVTREEWEEANNRADRRKRKVYPFTGRLHCPRCGMVMRHCEHSYGGTWQCSNYYENGKDACAGLWVKDKALMATEKHTSGHWTIEEEVVDGRTEYRLIPFNIR